MKYALAQNPDLFTTPHMVHLVVNILTMYKFKYNTRKRIFQLIDKSISGNDLDADWEYYI